LITFIIFNFAIFILDYKLISINIFLSRGYNIMKKNAFILLVILTLSFTGFGQKSKTAAAKAAAQAAADEKAVRAAFEDLLNGIRNSNVDAVTGVYWNSPKTLFYNNNGSVTIGWEQDRKNREARYPRISNVKLEVRNVNVMLLGSGGAFVACQWKQAQDFEGNEESASGRMTLVFQKTGKDWKIVHLHTSPDNPPATRPVMPSEKTDN
jgi:ketosteroid isomerase-like protein